MQLILFVLFALLAALLCPDDGNSQGEESTLTAEQCQFFQDQGKVAICHRTGWPKPYKLVKVATASCINVHAGHAGDYIAYGDLTCSGQGCFPLGAPRSPGDPVPCCDGMDYDASGHCAPVATGCDESTCGANASCSGEAAGDACVCDAGFEGDAIAGCTDIDDCADGPCGQGACTDLGANAYGCVCDSGFHDDGTTCVPCGELDGCAAVECTNATDATCTSCTVGFLDAGVCLPHSVCTEDEYELTAPTPTSDRACAPVTLCADAEFEVTAPTATTDRECAPCTEIASCTAVRCTSSTDEICVDNEIHEFSASSTVVAAGDSVILTWATRNAASCTLDPGAEAASPEDFGMVALAVDQPTTFTLTCDGPSGPTARSVYVDVADGDWTQVAAGGSHTCAIKADGRLFCWGLGTNGQLGSNATSQSLVAVQEHSMGDDWAQVAAGGSHTCAIKADGRLFCWGLGANGRLGTGSTTQSLVPVQEQSLGDDWAQVAAGASHTCAVKTDGRLFCWGLGNNGRLGTNTSAQSLVPVQEHSADEDWVQVSAGNNHTCAVKVDGSLFCWGLGNAGQLATNSTAQSLVPVREHSQGQDWVEVAAGNAHTCAIKGDGSLFCWGLGTSGQLGHDSTAQSLVPVREHSQANDWSEVALGISHTCAAKADGRLFCWGLGANGQLGNDASGQSLVPVEVQSEAGDWARVTAGNAHTCATETDGSLFCWGLGTTGQLGNGATGQSPVPVEEHSQEGNWAQAAAGTAHSCAVKADGSLFCWGLGTNGQLGNGSTAQSLVPVRESSLGNDWAQVSLGAAHTCAVKTDASLFCWGQGTSGQLGGNATAQSLVPAQESTSAQDWVEVAAGGFHSCAVKDDGRLFCWGLGSSGRLGHDSTTNSLVPVQESSQEQDWAQVSAGGAHTCAVKSDGSLFCWGQGTNGQLGNGSSAGSLVPSQEALLDGDWAQVSAGGAHSCAVKTDGSLFCWGLGSNGQLGRNSTAQSLVPVQESSAASDWARVAAGGSHTCAIKTDGRVLCWGQGNNGQLGHAGATQSLVPVAEITEARNWLQVAVGASHTCAVKADGRLFCWGADEGRLGVGTPLWPVWPTASP